MTKAIVILSMLLLAACGSTAAPASKPAAVTQIKISYNTTAATDLPFLVAEQEGYFDAQQVHVTMVSMTPQVAITALSKGEIDFMNSPSNSIEGMANGLPFKIVFDSWDGSAWSLVGKSDITSVQQLKGKVVATNNPGTAPYAFLRAGLKKNGMAVSDVQYLPLAGTSTVYAAITGGKVDAGVISPPFSGQAVEQGFREIMFLGDLLELPSNGLSTTTTYIAQHRDVVEALIRAMWQSETWIKAHPDETAAIIAKRLNASPSVAKSTYDRMLPLLTTTGETPVAGIQQNIQLLEESTGKKISIDPAQFGDFGPLHEALAQSK
ncbi:MAG TPA: ABC transporter substrate-binding protein [Chloroflexota bacterium]|nr:ABC transporter substrate-binding protein [Chloroflexota bacterium]